MDKDYEQIMLKLEALELKLKEFRNEFGKRTNFDPCKHGRYPCKKCGVKHFDNCQYHFCITQWRKYDQVPKT